MSFAAQIDREYQATRMSREEEREAECKREGCDSPIDETKPCEWCGRRFCPSHLYLGECAGCMVISDAADAIIAAYRSAA